MKLYVGNLSYQLREEELQDAFGQFGEVLSVRIITERDSGRSKGFGFVEFAQKADAQNAIDSLDGQDLAGRPLVVNEARPKAPRR